MAVVYLHSSIQPTWPQLYVCLSFILCPFCISHCPQLGQEKQEHEEAPYRPQYQKVID
jgi:hypothetical protein